MSRRLGILILGLLMVAPLMALVASPAQAKTVWSNDPPWDVRDSSGAATTNPEGDIGRIDVSNNRRFVRIVVQERALPQWRANTRRMLHVGSIKVGNVEIFAALDRRSADTGFTAYTWSPSPRGNVAVRCGASTTINEATAVVSVNFPQDCFAATAKARRLRTKQARNLKKHLDVRAAFSTVWQQDNYPVPVPLTIGDAAYTNRYDYYLNYSEPVYGPFVARG